MDIYADLAANSSAVRPVGDSTNIDANTFNLYEQDWLRGQVEFIDADKQSPELAGNHNSLLITGTSNWTVYEGVSYTGPNMCLITSIGNIEYIEDLTKIGIQPGSLRSVRKGCEANPPVLVNIQTYELNALNNTGFLK